MHLRGRGSKGPTKNVGPLFKDFVMLCSLNEFNILIGAGRGGGASKICGVLSWNCFSFIFTLYNLKLLESVRTGVQCYMA